MFLYCKTYIGRVDKMYAPCAFLLVEAIPFSESLYMVWDMAPIEII